MDGVAWTGGGGGCGAEANNAFAAACGTANPAPSANLNINCSRPVAPRSIPDRSISSVSKDVFVFTSSRSVTFPTFMGRPANSNPFSCSSAFFASSALWNYFKLRKRNKMKRSSSGNEIDFTHRYKSVTFRPIRLWVHDELDAIDLAEWFKDSTQHVFGDVEM